MSLNSDLWEVDAWEFTRLSAIPSVEARTAAMRLYRNNFAGHVGVYDDALITVRRRLETLWCDVAIGLLADGALSPDLLADEADRLEIRYPRLLNALAEYHQ